jgi:catechol 2,3-dioxygenase-like lactoylglutathione lyase family enzyme
VVQNSLYAHNLGKEANMLGSSRIVAFIPTTKPGDARRFYETTIGLEFVTDDGFALIFNANGILVRVSNVSRDDNFTPAGFTIFGWDVNSIEDEVRDLAARGVVFELYDGIGQDQLGIWEAPSGDRVAWFKDPEGNILSITEYYP